MQAMEPESYACLYAKEFPTQALLRLRPDLRQKACVVLDGEPHTSSVCSLNVRARAVGAAHGMTQVETETLPTLTVLMRSRSEEHAAQAALRECAGNFSPRVEDRSSEAAFVCVLDIAGTEKLFGTVQQLAQTLLRRVEHLGVIASVAVSSNFHTAVYLAKGVAGRSRITVVPYGQESSSLGQVPLSVFEMKAEHAETFTLWGIRTLGMLGALPEKELVARMGQEGRRLRQLARGEATHLFQPIEPVFALEEKLELDSPVEILDSLLFVIGVMLEQLVLRASARVLALASVSIRLSLEGGGLHTRTVRPALPTNDRKLWMKLLHLDLEAHPPQAAILALMLTAKPGSVSEIQLGLFSPQLPEPGRLDITLARIAKIVGEYRVGRAILEDTHRSQGFRMERFVVLRTQAANTLSTRTPSTLRQIRPAELIAVMLVEQHPKSFQFREQRYLVERAYGPWLASGDWWNATSWGQAQWDLVARTKDGASLYCCVMQDRVRSEWQIVGLYD